MRSGCYVSGSIAVLPCQRSALPLPPCLNAAPGLASLHPFPTPPYHAPPLLLTPQERSFYYAKQEQADREAEAAEAEAFRTGNEATMTDKTTTYAIGGIVGGAILGWMSQFF